MNKDLLISFLNGLFNNSEKEIEDVQYLNGENLGQRLFDQAEIAKYSDAERRLYEASQKEYWDYTSTLETAERKGIQLGMFHEKIDTIHRLQSMGLSLEQIAQGADMKVDEVRKLLQ
jgi:predicted transposase/invertase (TIGR01784 family)